MKKLLVIIAITFLVVSCVKTGEEPTPSNPSDSRNSSINQWELFFKTYQISSGTLTEGQSMPDLVSQYVIVSDCGTNLKCDVFTVTISATGSPQKSNQIGDGDSSCFPLYKDPSNSSKNIQFTGSYQVNKNLTCNDVGGVQILDDTSSDDSVVTEGRVLGTIIGDGCLVPNLAAEPSNGKVVLKTVKTFYKISDSQNASFRTVCGTKIPSNARVAGSEVVTAGGENFSKGTPIQKSDAGALANLYKVAVTQDSLKFKIKFEAKKKQSSEQPTHIQKMKGQKI